jgi:hypothetical protein
MEFGVQTPGERLNQNQQPLAIFGYNKAAETVQCSVGAVPGEFNSFALKFLQGPICGNPSSHREQRIAEMLPIHDGVITPILKKWQRRQGILGRTGSGPRMFPSAIWFSWIGCFSGGLPGILGP